MINKLLPTTRKTTSTNPEFIKPPSLTKERSQALQDIVSDDEFYEDAQSRSNHGKQNYEEDYQELVFRKPYPTFPEINILVSSIQRSSCFSQMSTMRLIDDCVTGYWAFPSSLPL